MRHVAAVVVFLFTVGIAMIIRFLFPPTAYRTFVVVCITWLIAWAFYTRDERRGR